MLQTTSPFIPVETEYGHERVLAEFPRRARGGSRVPTPARPVRDRGGLLRRFLKSFS